MTGANRRTLADITEWLTPDQIYTLITQRVWKYKVNKEFYETRDKALMALYFITAARNLELLPNPKRNYKGLRKSNFDFFSLAPDFIVLKSVQIVKRKDKTIRRLGPKVTIREDILLPLNPRHEIYPFVRLIINYLDLLEDNDILFKFKTGRSWQIIERITGKWVHWFRAMSENYYGKVLKEGVKLAKFVGVTKVESVLPYIPLDEEDYRDKLSRRVRRD